MKRVAGCEFQSMLTTRNPQPATRMQDIIAFFRKVVIQIATPYSKGTGFYLKTYQVIVTNEHVVRGNRQVVIQGNNLERQLAKVLYLDQKLDLAFLSLPKDNTIPEVHLDSVRTLSNGEPIIAIGHPFGLKYTSTLGIISNAFHSLNDINYFQHDAALNPGNSGGPLLDEKGHIVGVNTFVIRDGENVGFSLPVHYLKKTLEEFQHKETDTAARCISCSNIVYDSTIEDRYCPTCGAKIILPSQTEEFEPVGVSKTIETLLTKTGHDVKLSRRGPNNWEIREGSAKINITYHKKTGLIIGDAYLCTLPKENIKPIYQYLLKQNYQIDGLTFSINPKGNEIILSLLIYDRYLNVETGIQLFKHLFEKADHFDNILVEEYGAIWKTE